MWNCSVTHGKCFVNDWRIWTSGLAIVLDGELRSAPRIMEVISGGRGVIGGGFTPREALGLANILQRPLEVPLRVVEERTF